MRDVLIGSTVRSGGSLTARLFDHHPQLGAYPFELHLPMDPALHPSLARRGERDQVQDFPRLHSGLSPEQMARAIGLDRDPRRCLVGAHFRGGRLRAKSRHLEIATQLDHASFFARFCELAAKSASTADAYRALHRAFFESWDEGAHGGTLEVAVYHRANGLLCDAERFLREFENSRLIIPIRSAAACLASEKRKVLSQVVSGRIARGWRPSDRFVRHATGRFVEATLVSWLMCVTRAVMLRERLGDSVVVFRYESLVKQPEPMMRAIAQAADVPFHPSLLVPTNAGHAWAGNSMFTRIEGIDAEQAEPRDVLNETELELIEQYAGRLHGYLESKSEPQLLDFADLDRRMLFDYEHQARYFGDREKSALYFASLYERWPREAWHRQLRGALSSRPRRYFL